MSTNKMLSEQLTESYENRIVHLQSKIEEQQKEITQLQEQIKLLSQKKYCDC